MKLIKSSKTNGNTPINKGRYYLYLSLAVILAIVQVYFAIAVKNLINAVEYQSGSDKLFTSAVIVVAVVIISFLLGVFAKLLANSCQTSLEYSLKSKLFSDFLNGNYSEVQKVLPGDLVSRLEGDVNTVASVKTNLYPQVFSTIVKLLGTAVALFVLQPTFTVIALLVTLIIAISSYYVRKVIYKLHANTRGKSSMQAVFLTETSLNSATIKTFNAEDYASANLNSKFLEYQNAKLKQKDFSALVGSAISLAFTCFYAVTVIFGAYGISKGIWGVNFGVLTALLQLILQVRTPITSISGFFTAHAEMQVASNRLNELFLENVDNKIELSTFDKIIFDSVDFKYDDLPILQNVSFEINKGENLVIKGQSGVGKTTIIKLLTGLYKPTSGSVKVIVGDKEYNACEVKNLFACSLQSSTLFTKTVKENVVFNSEYDQDKYDNAVKTACLTDVLSGVSDSLVLNKDVNFSEGEKQRVTIARAIYSLKAITVLDEPSSALDLETEKSLVDNLKKDKNTTFIIVSHRPAFDSFGKVITLENGKII